MWNFVSFPAPLPMLFSHEKNVALQKYIFAPGKTEGNFPLRKTGNQLRNRRLPPFLLWTLRSLFSGETTSFSRIIFGVRDPIPTPNPNLQPTKNPNFEAEKIRKFRRPMLRSWNKWKPCIASYKPINPRPPCLFHVVFSVVFGENVFFFCGGVWWNAKDVGAGIAAVWFKRWLKKRTGFWSYALKFQVILMPIQKN